MSAEGFPGRVLARVSATGTRAALSLLVLSGFLEFFRLGARGLFEPDEGRYAEMPREMIALGDWITPHLNYVLFLEKPPLVLWMTAGLYRILGEIPVAARFPSAFFTVLAVVATASFGRRLVGARAAWLGGAILATAALPLVIGRVATLDAVLASLVTLSIFAFHAALRAAEASPRRRDGWLLAAYVSAGLATLVKGLVGVALPGLVIGLHLLLTGRLREIRHLRLISGAILYLAISAPWFIAVSRKTPYFFQYFFVHETLMRYTTTVHSRTGSVLYYVPVLLAGMAPWSLLIPRAIAGAWRDRRVPEGGGSFFLGIWTAAVFLFFSFAGSKLPGYLLPAFPPLALLLGGTFVPRSGDRVPEALDRPWWVAVSLGLLAAVGLGGLVVPAGVLARLSPTIVGETRLIGTCMLAIAGLGLYALRRGSAALAALALGAWIVLLTPTLVRVSEMLEDRYSVAPIARRSARRAEPEDLLVQYRGFAKGLPFYFGRRVVLYRHVGELQVGFTLSDPKERSRWFLTEQADLARLFAGDRRVLVLVSRKDEPDLKARFPSLLRLDESERYALYANRPPRASGASPAAP